MRVLAIKLATVGDVLLTTPALKALKGSLGAEITLLTPPQSAGVLVGTGLVDHFLAFDKYRFDSAPGSLRPGRLREVAGFLRGLGRRPYDACLVFHHLSTRWGAAKFAVLTRASGAPVRAGLDNGRGGFLTHRAPDLGFGAKHEVEYWLEVAALTGATTADTRLSLPGGAGEATWAAAMLPDGAPWVAVHAGSGGYSRARRWEAGRFAAVAARLMADGLRIVLVGGPDERELSQRVIADYGSDSKTAIVDLTGRTSLAELAAVLGRCAAFVGGDSGVMHVAAAAGTPVVAIFGPTNAGAWGPWYGTQVQSSRFNVQSGAALNVEPGTLNLRGAVLQAELPCSPCLYRGHALGRREGCPPRTCLQLVSPEMVYAAVREALAGREAPVSRRRGPEARHGG
jgi:heptosyltransferase-2